MYGPRRTQCFVGSMANPQPHNPLVLACKPRSTGRADFGEAWICRRGSVAGRATAGGTGFGRQSQEVDIRPEIGAGRGSRELAMDRGDRLACHVQHLRFHDCIDAGIELAGDALHAIERARKPGPLPGSCLGAGLIHGRDRAHRAAGLHQQLTRPRACLSAAS